MCLNKEADASLSTHLGRLIYQQSYQVLIQNIYHNVKNVHIQITHFFCRHFKTMIWDHERIVFFLMSGSCDYNALCLCVALVLQLVNRDTGSNYLLQFPHAGPIHSGARIE